ncbi:MAG: hypothetical protein R6W73_02615 [Candidatus Saliniplasma sp.]
MKWKKMMSVLIAAVFVISGVAVLANSTSAQEEAQYIQDITLEVRTTQETGLGDTAVGDLDVFIQSVPGELYDGISDDWKANLAVWTSTGSYNNFIFNPAFDKDTTDDYPDEEVSHFGGLPVIEVDGEWQFNPMADREIRFANNFMIDRTEYLEDLYDNWGSERYIALGQEAPGYGEYFQDMVEDLEIDEDGDWDRAYNMIQDRMEYWEAHDGIADVTGDEVTNEGTRDNPEWHFAGEQIELISCNRIEDERLSIGHDWSNKMEDMGFTVTREDGESASLWGLALGSDASDMLFHMYTGGWLASTANIYQEAAMNQMYLGWYGWTIGLGGADFWQIGDVQDPEIVQKGKDLMNGRAEDEEQYWDYMVDVCEYGTKEAVRVFLLSTQDVFAYDESRVAEAATDVVTGWAGIYSPRTLKVRDENGEFKAAQYSTTGSLYMDNWNEIDGSGDTYSMQQQDMARDYTMYNHPSDGMPIGIRTEYDYDRDYEWVEEGNDTVLDKNMPVPSDAWDYDTENEEWVQVGDGLEAATSVTFDFYENNDGDLGTYHDENPMEYKDILAWYAFSKELSIEDEDGKYYYSPYGDVNSDFFETVHGIELNEEDGEVTSYTVYGDYTFPAESKVANYYSQTAIHPWQVWEAARIMYAQDDSESDLWSGTPGEGETWSWQQAADNWVHFIGTDQGETFEEVMQNMIDNDWQPAYLETMPDPLGTTDVATEVQRSIDFWDAHNHFFISQGPFKITVIDEANMVMEMERWGEDDGYPLAIDHWEDKLAVQNIELRQVNMPSRVDAGEEFEVEAFAQIREEYPTKSTYDADHGEVTVKVDADGETREATVDEPVEDGRFLVDVPADFTEGLDGSQTIVIEARIPAAVSPAIVEKSLLVLPGETDYTVEDFDVAPTQGDAPLDITVSATISSGLGESQDVSIKVNGDTWDTVTLDAGETVSYQEDFPLEESGEYEVAIGEQKATVQVTEPEETPLEVTDMTVDPDSGVAPLDVSITAEVYNPRNESADFDVTAAGEVINTLTVDADETVSVDETYTFDDPSDYHVYVAHRRTSVRVEPEEEPEADIVVTNFEVEDDGLEVTITADLENQGDAEGDITLYADGEEVKSWRLGAGETAEVDETYEFDEEGTYTIELGDSSEEVEVEEDETPGFTLAVLAISAVAAVLLYHKKKNYE